MKKLAIALVPVVLLAACGSSDNPYGPEDYKHFSPYFTMNESAANEMGAAPAGEMGSAQQNQSTSVLTQADAGVTGEMSASVAAQ